MGVVEALAAAAKAASEAGIDYRFEQLGLACVLPQAPMNSRPF